MQSLASDAGKRCISDPARTSGGSLAAVPDLDIYPSALTIVGTANFPSFLLLEMFFAIAALERRACGNIGPGDAGRDDSTHCFLLLPFHVILYIYTHAYQV